MSVQRLDGQFGEAMGVGHALIKGSHLPGRETGVNIKYLANPFGIKYKLDGFELGVAPPCDGLRRRLEPRDRAEEAARQQPRRSAAAQFAMCGPGGPVSLAQKEF